MATQMYVNLPVKDLDRSVNFFTASALASTRSSPTATPPAW
ncbi:putative lactoylglutathione lyase [Polaromonas sp. CG_9.11]|nr:putative lactoylglutathione lyase [Polaromonas sp. CG_9.11]